MAKTIDFIDVLWLTRIPLRNSGAKVRCICGRKKCEMNIFAKKHKSSSDLGITFGTFL